MGRPKITKHPSTMDGLRKLASEGRFSIVGEAAASCRMDGETCIPSMFRVPITIKLPPSSNSLFYNRKTGQKGKGRGITPEYKAWRDSMIPIALGMPSPPSYPVLVCMLLYPGLDWDPQADVGNRTKAVEDLLVAAKVIPDDNARFVAGIFVKWVEFKIKDQSEMVVWFDDPKFWPSTIPVSNQPQRLPA
jgi:hypothetical protein